MSPAAEFAFENPFPTNLAFDLCFDNGQLSIVTDAEEWAHHKTKHNLSSPLERNFMSPGGKQVYLNAREVIYIPFAVRSNNWSYTREAVEGDVDKTIPEGVPGIQALKPGNHLHEIALTVRLPLLACTHLLRRKAVYRFGQLPQTK